MGSLDDLLTCLSSGWDEGSIDSLEAAGKKIFSTSRLNGRMYAQASVTMGADLIAPVMWIFSCLCILASLATKPFVPLVAWLSGTRKMSEAYSIFGLATEV